MLKRLPDSVVRFAGGFAVGFASYWLAKLLGADTLGMYAFPVGLLIGYALGVWVARRFEPAKSREHRSSS